MIKIKKILNSIKKKRSPFVEPYLEKYIKKYGKNVEICEDVDNLVNKTNVTFLVLPTPSQRDGSFSNQYILNVLKKIGISLKNKRNKKHLINVTSTLSPYSCEKILIPFLEKYNLKNERDFLISYNPHFIAQGTTIYNLNNPDILLIGTNSSKARRILKNIYKKIYIKKNVFKNLNLLESEIAKLSVNTFITNKISFANYISELSENSKNADASYGLCSRWGIIAFASSLDQAGVFSKNITDAALLMQQVAGYDKNDSTSANIKIPNYLENLNDEVSGKVIGIPNEYNLPNIPDEIKQVWENAKKTLELGGAKIKNISLPHTKYALPTYYIIAPAEASSNLARYDGVKYGYVLMIKIL